MPQVLPLSLQNRRPGRIRPELGPLRAALARLGDPQFACPSVLVVGTNGKGSTAAMLEAVLRAHGLRTGLTTSPHLVSVEERIRIDGRRIDRAALDGHLDRLAADVDLTFFETITAAAFLAFARSGVEVAILEAGMGGSWDATRVADSAIAGLTNVGSDHAEWLGDDVLDRARDKGAPLRSARWSVVGPDVGADLLAAVAAPDAVAAGDLVRVRGRDGGRVCVSWATQEVELAVPLAGDHQRGNLQLALALAVCAERAGLIRKLDPDAVVTGLGHVSWPGRLTETRVGGRSVLLDGAHNLEGAEVLAAELRRRQVTYNLLFSCLDDKPAEAMAEVLSPVVGDIAVCGLDDPRAMAMERLRAAFPAAEPVPSPEAGIAHLGDPVVAAGSLRLVGRLLELAEEGVVS
ncbi:MAG: Mur ligase family protein [Acidimicrobiia bacterium]